MGDEYYLQEPRNQKFYRMLTLLMSFITLGDRRLMGFEKPPTMAFINSKIMRCFGPLVVISQLIYLYVNWNELTFDILGIIFSVFPATCLTNVNIISSKLKSYKNLISKLFTEIHLYTVYKDDKDDFVKKRLIKTEQYTRWSSGYLVFFFFISWFNWISFTALNNYKNRELVHNHTVKLQTCVFLWLPVDYSYNFQNWYIVHSINVHVVACGVTIMAAFQSVNNIFVYNLIGHIHILKHKIRTDFKGNLSDAQVHDSLVNIIKYHSFITRVFKEVEYAFGFYVIANYAQNLLGSSILLFQLTYGGRGNMLLYITMIAALTGGPVLMSFVLEEVKQQTYDLPEVVYSMPWEDMSVSNQKTVLLVLQHVQKIFEFEALGILIAGVKPMVSILKTTMSYYLMLETTMAVKS